MLLLAEQVAVRDLLASTKACLLLSFEHIHDISGPLVSLQYVVEIPNVIPQHLITLDSV